MIKKDFIKYMRELLSIIEAGDKLSKSFKKFEPDFGYVGFSRYENLVVRVLEIAMNDKYQWISYWLYDCNYGKNSLSAKDKHGKNIPLKTLSNLYDCIKNDE